MVPESEQRVGCVLTSDEEIQLRSMSKLPLRFWAWTPTNPNNQTDSTVKTTTAAIQTVEARTTEQPKDTKAKP